MNFQIFGNKKAPTLLLIPGFFVFVLIMIHRSPYFVTCIPLRSSSEDPFPVPGRYSRPLFPTLCHVYELPCSFRLRVFRRRVFVR